MHAYVYIHSYQKYITLPQISRSTLKAKLAQLCTFLRAGRHRGFGSVKVKLEFHWDFMGFSDSDSLILDDSQFLETVGNNGITWHKKAVILRVLSPDVI